MNEKYLQYAAIILAVVSFLVSYEVFVTPAEMETRFTKFSGQIEQKYATRHDMEANQKQLDNISAKIDKIYDYIIGGKK